LSFSTSDKEGEFLSMEKLGKGIAKKNVLRHNIGKLTAHRNSMNFFFSSGEAPKEVCA